METDAEYSPTLRLTREQRVQVYEEECARLLYEKKQRIEAGKEPVFGRKVLACVMVYGFGCALLYLGVLDTLFDLIGGHGLGFKLQPHVFMSIFESALIVANPILAIVGFGVFVGGPLFVVWGMWHLARDLIKRL